MQAIDPGKLISQPYYFTFDPEHRNQATGEFMYGYYVKINAVDEEAARFAMFNSFAGEWAFMFTAGEFNAQSCPKGEYAECDAKPFSIPEPADL